VDRGDGGKAVTDSQTGRPFRVAITLRGTKPPATPGAPMEPDTRIAAQVALILQHVLDESLKS